MYCVDGCFYDEPGGAPATMPGGSGTGASDGGGTGTGGSGTGGGTVFSHLLGTSAHDSLASVSVGSTGAGADSGADGHLLRVDVGDAAAALDVLPQESDQNASTSLLGVNILSGPEELTVGGAGLADGGVGGHLIGHLLGTAEDLGTSAGSADHMAACTMSVDHDAGLLQALFDQIDHIAPHGALMG
jgi:hypothetical protein